MKIIKKVEYKGKILQFFEKEEEYNGEDVTVYGVYCPANHKASFGLERNYPSYLHDVQGTIC